MLPPKKTELEPKPTIVDEAKWEEANMEDVSGYVSILFTAIHVVLIWGFSFLLVCCNSTRNVCMMRSGRMRTGMRMRGSEPVMGVPSNVLMQGSLMMMRRR